MRRRATSTPLLALIRNTLHVQGVRLGDVRQAKSSSLMSVCARAETAKWSEYCAGGPLLQR